MTVSAWLKSLFWALNLDSLKKSPYVTKVFCLCVSLSSLLLLARVSSYEIRVTVSVFTSIWCCAISAWYWSTYPW